MTSRLAIAGGRPVRDRPFAPANSIGAEERRAVLEVLDSGVLSQFLGVWGDEFFGGPRVRMAEQAFARRLGARHAIAVNSATTGLQVAVAAAGVGPGDEVIVSPYTMSASAAAILLHNAVPVFADIEAETFCLDPASVEERITPRTRAILVVHLFGHPARIDELLEVARAHDLMVIEDAAQSIGATYGGRESGTLGDVGVLSLNRHKIIHCGEGGIVLTDDDQRALVAQLARNHGEVVVEQASPDDISNTLGSNFRPTEIEAAIAYEQLQKLDRLLAVRRELAAHLTQRVSGLPGLTPPVVAEGCTHSFYLYAMRVDEEALDGVSRAALAAALRAEGAPVSEGYVRPIYRQAVYQHRIGRGRRGCPWTCGHWHGDVSYAPGICPVTERLYERELLLTDVCRHPLTHADIDDVGDAFEKVFTHTEQLRVAQPA